jgi:hypothetical protein
MNLGDSFGISIFVGKSSRFAPKISASHLFGVLGVGIAMIWGDLLCGFLMDFL